MSAAGSAFAFHAKREPAHRSRFSSGAPVGSRRQARCCLHAKALVTLERVSLRRPRRRPAGRRRVRAQVLAARRPNGPRVPSVAISTRDTAAAAIAPMAADVRSKPVASDGSSATAGDTTVAV
jgi:hypothetical protein